MPHTSYCAVLTPSDDAAAHLRPALERAGFRFWRARTAEEFVLAAAAVADLTACEPEATWAAALRRGAGLPTVVLVRRAPPLLGAVAVLAPDGIDAAAAEEVAERLGEARSGQADPDPLVLAARRAPPLPDGRRREEVFGTLEKAGAPARAAAPVLARIAELAARSDHEALSRVLDEQDGPVADLPIVVEQVALSLNRLARAASRAGDHARARELRTRALRLLEQRIPAGSWTGSTFAAAGRIHKFAYDDLRHAGRELEAERALENAIDMYEAGLRADPSDLVCGLNAVTLRLVAYGPEDRERLADLLPVVRLAIERRLPRSPAERGWLAATRLELACAARDWEAADRALRALLAEPQRSGLLDATVGNLRLLVDRFGDDPEDVEILEGLISELIDAEQ